VNAPAWPARAFAQVTTVAGACGCVGKIPAAPARGAVAS
jgi:hypothetical protein